MLTDADPPVGALYLSASRANEPFLVVLNLFNPHYDLLDVAPIEEESEKAYMGLGSGADTHVPALFDYSVAEEFHVAGRLDVFLFISCDIPTVAPQPDSPPVRIDLEKNGESFAEGSGGTSPAICAPGEIYEMVVSVPNVEAFFEPGDEFRVEVGTGGFFNPGDPVANLHVLVESTLYPSRIEAPGLPGPPS